MEGKLKTQEELLRENKGLRASYNRMNEMLVFFQKKVNDLPWKDETTSLFDSMAQRYKKPPPHVKLDDPTVSCSQLMELLRRNNSDLSVFNQCMSRDLSVLETKFHDLMSQRTRSEGTQTLIVWKDLEESSRLLLQEKEAWEADEKVLQEQISLLTQQKCEAEDRERRALQEIDALEREIQKLKDNVDRTAIKLEAELEFDQLLILELQEEARDLRQRERLLEDRLQSEAASPNQSNLLSVWRWLFGVFNQGQREPE